MNDTEFAYPEFKEGQVLTHNDLNLLRDYLYTKSMFHGRALFGFGVCCGLDGRIDGGTTYKTSTGFALAQGGRELRLTAEASIGLGGTITPDPTVYSFIDPLKGGFTPILRPADTIEAPGGQCDETGCTTHTEVVHEAVEVVLVTGQLKLDPAFENPVFTLQPLDPKTNPSLTGFPALREGLRSALSGLLDAATLDYLLPAKLKLEGPPGVDLRKVGLVNEVLYTARDYFACKAMTTVPCGGLLGPERGVALGWLQKTGTTWSWDPRYRHFFRLSLALHRAMSNFRGQDLCQRYLDHIRVLLESFEVPVIPPPTGNGTAPPVKDPPTVHLCSLLDVWYGLCPEWPKKPPKDLPYEVDLIDPTRVKWPWPGPIGPDDYMPVTLDETILPVTLLTLDPADSGVIYVTDLLGTKADKAGDNIREAIEEAGLDPKVTVLTMDEFNEVEGLVPALAAAASDAIFLGKNEAGAVVATGSVPTTRAIGDVAGIAETARNAESVAKGMDDRITGVESGFNQFKDEINDSFGDYKLELDGMFTQFKNSLPLDKINAAAGLDEKVNTLNATVTGHGATLDQLNTRTRTLELRTIPTGGVTLPGRVTTINTSLYESLDAMRDAIKAGSTQRAGPTVRRTLAAVDAQFEVLRRESVEDVSLMEAHPEALGEVMDGIVNAVAAMGLPADSPEYKNLTKTVDALKGAMGIG